MIGFQTGRSMADARQVEAIKRALAERDAADWQLVRVLLEQRPCTSRELIRMTGATTWREGSRRSAWLRRLERQGKIVRAGETKGPTGHLNIIWALA